MKIAVIGAGGVGGYFGGRLAAAGNDVTFVARGAHLHALRHSGLTLLSPLGDLHLPSVGAVESIAHLPPVDLVLLAVKLWDTDAVAEQLPPLVAQGAAVLSLQNGVEKDLTLRNHLPAESLLGGLCYISAAIEGPGAIRHRGSMQRIVFGDFNSLPSPRAQAFLEACQTAAIDASLSDTIEKLIWEKFVFLVGLSGATTSMRQNIGAVLANAQTRSFLLDLMREVVAVGRAKAIDLPPDFAENRLAFCHTLPPAMTSSMHGDLERGNRLELPWLSGAVVRLGNESGIPTSLNRAVSDILAPFEQGAFAQ